MAIIAKHVSVYPFTECCAALSTFSSDCKTTKTEVPRQISLCERSHSEMGRACVAKAHAIQSYVYRAMRGSLYVSLRTTKTEVARQVDAVISERPLGTDARSATQKLTVTHVRRLAHMCADGCRANAAGIGKV